MRIASQFLTFVLLLPLSAALSACADDDDGKGRTDPSQLPAEDVVVSDCDADGDCIGGRCIEGIGTGLCTVDCNEQADCPEDTICTDTESESGGVCLFACTDGQFCTDQLGPAYTCDTESNLTTGEDVRVCIDSR